MARGSHSEFSPAAILAASITLTARLAGAAAIYGFFILLGRTFGAAAFGQFVVATTAVNLIALLARLGVDHGVLRLTGDRLAAGDEESANASIGLAILTSFGAGLLLTLLAWLALGTDNAYARALRGAQQPILFAIPVIATAHVMYASLRARHQAARASMVEGIVRPLCAFGLAVAATLWWRQEIAFALAFLISWIVGVIVMGSLLRWRLRVNRADVRPLLATSLPMLGVALLQQNNTALDVLVLALAVPPDVVGHYGAAQKITQAILMIYMAITTVFAPYIPAIASDREALGNFYRSTTRWILIATLPALIVTSALPEVPLSFFGPEFTRTASLPLTILSVSVLVHVAIGPAVYLLMMAGRPAVMLRPYAAAIVITGAALAALVPLAGVNGAACAMLISSIVLRILLYRVVHRELGVSSADRRSAVLIAGAVAIAIGAKLLSLVAGSWVAAAVAVLAFGLYALPTIRTMPLRAALSERQRSALS